MKRARGPTRKLPDGIDFLAPDLPASFLGEAAARADALGAWSADLLIAEGLVDEAEYYWRLAEHIGARFMLQPAALAPDADWRAALRTGVARMADGRWLVAPRGAAIEALIQRVRHGHSAERLMIACPTEFERTIFAQYGAEIADDAAGRLANHRPDFSARTGLSPAQKRVFLAICALLAAQVAGGVNLWVAASLPVAFVMCVAVLVRLGATLLALTVEREPDPLDDSDLPVYSVLVALYDEAEVAPRLVAAMKALDYPAARYEVIFLVEHDDAATREALDSQDLPAHFRIVTAPEGAPRTKPRALNIGLMVALGELLVVYDAEDRPDPQQLRMAASRFRSGPSKLAVLQAQLRIENHADSWLARLFALDYAVQFSVLLPGMAKLGLALPLGGTSNHFRSDLLQKAGGWDPWNVTEDADLGIRLARLGYLCQTLPSATWEEAPPTLRDWLPQRRRWLKGWMQTLLTHTRSPLRLVLDLGLPRACHALALLASNTFGPAVGLWITLYVLYEAIAGDFLIRHSGLSQVAAWLWAGLAALGALSIILPTVVATARLRLWRSAPYLLLRPAHWLCISTAAFQAIHDLWMRPHHWLKTRHGLARRGDPAP